MKDQVLASGSIGSQGSYTVETVSGDVKASVSYSGTELVGSVSLTVKSKAGLEELKNLIPGQIDDAVINLIEAALGV